MRLTLALPPILLFTALSTWGKPPESHVEFPIGVTKDNTPVICWLDKESLDAFSPKKHVLLVIGMEPGQGMEKEALANILQEAGNKVTTHTHSIVLDANPDDLPLPAFPPKGPAYNQKETAATHYLWRFIGNYGFDTVVDITKSEAQGDKPPEFGDTPFTLALKQSTPANVAPVKASQFNHLIILNQQETAKSPARIEIQKRLIRRPIETAQQLAKHYGKDPRAQYIPALAQLSRLRIAELANAPEHRTAVLNSLLPYATGEKNPLGKKVSGVNLAGHLTIAELAKTEKNPAFTKLIVAAADQALASRSQHTSSPVAGHNQMSDSVFMVCPLLAAAHGLTGKQEYLDACLAHYEYIRSICLRDDGIYRHSPQDEAAWGRGNGFPALGLALSLSWIPEDSPAHKPLLAKLQAHIDALLPHQDITGMWHQVIDHPEVYREMTSTCMFTFAIARCLNRGWLPKAKYLPVVKKSWPAINRRISPNGELLDVCTGTGKQKNLRAYFDRTAILGKDSRGGAMALMAATEMAGLLRKLKENDE